MSWSIYAIKCLDIGFVTCIYAVMAIICAAITDRLLDDTPQEEHSKPAWRRMVDMVCIMWLYGMLIYFARNLVPHIPFPLDNVSGYSHMRLKELHNATVFTFLYMLFSEKIKSRLMRYYNLIREAMHAQITIL
jgi:hypothetical protein